MPEPFAALRATIERYAAAVPEGEEPAARAAFLELKAALNAGTVRAAERGADGVWRVNTWVKQGILLGFRIGRLAPAAGAGARSPSSTRTPTRSAASTLDDGVRIVPGGLGHPRRLLRRAAASSACRRCTSTSAPGWTRARWWTSHALVGSCAQIGKRVHLSAAAQIGGVLEPVGALPVIVEDDVLVGGNCGVYEGAVVRERAVLAPGTILTGGTPVFDLVHERVYRREGAGRSRSRPAPSSCRARAGAERRRGATGASGSTRR